MSEPGGSKPSDRNLMRDTLRRIAVAVVSVAPATIDWVAKVVVWPRPFWVYYYDPETIYFYGGLHLLRGRLPANVDNPGIPLHVLSAGIAALTGPTPLRYAQFLAAAHTLALMATIGAVVLLLATVLRDAPPLLQIAGVWTYFLAPQAFERLDIWSPEAFYLPLGAAVLALLWGRRPVAAGVIIGVAIAAKWIFLPWAGAGVAALLVGRRARDAFLLGAACLVGFVLSIAPVFAAWPRMFHLVMNPNEQSWALLFATAHGWAIWSAVTAIFVVATLRLTDLPAVTFAVIVISLTFLGAARNPAFRYLLPAAIGMLALFAVASSTRRAGPFIQGALLLLAGALSVKAVRDDLAAHRSRVSSSETLRARIEGVTPRHAVVLYGWRVPEPSFALRVMADDAADLEAIATLYPRDGHFNPWTRQVHLPPKVSYADYVVVSRADLANFPLAKPVAEIDSYVIGALR